MKHLNLSTLLTTVSVMLLGLSMLIISTAGIPKVLILGLFIVVVTFSLLAAITLRNINQIPNIDRSEKVLDIIFSTFELHAHKLPDDEDFDLDKLERERAISSVKNGKVDSFEIHL